MKLQRAITADEVEAFWRDGVVCLRGVLDAADVAAMEQPLAAILDTPAMADLSAMGDALATGGQHVLRDEASSRRGRFVSGVDHWRESDAFRDFSCDAALGSIAGALLRSSSIRLWEDSALVKEPGAAERTAWHQDMSYFHVDGEQVCTMWIPLDVVSADSGAVRFVVGSHRWSEVYRPNLFVSTMSIPGTEGAEMPDIDALAENDEVQVASFDTSPGDLTVHHARTVHGAGANTTDRWRRAISIRYCGDDVRYMKRPGAPSKPHHHDVTDGDALADPDCPMVWRAR
jgi:ectoine hydroxylase-related dioxygenase (phytanoyl-CoA dioxygenase family)